MTTSCAFFTQSAYKFCQKSQKKSILPLDKDKTDIVRTIDSDTFRSDRDLPALKKTGISGLRCYPPIICKDYRMLSIQGNVQ